MKKRNILTFILILALSLIIGACSNGSALKDDLPPYTDFIEGEGRIDFEVDEEVTIDGRLDEDIWTNCQNSIYWQSGDTKYLMPDGSRKDATVHTYFGENGIYVAVEVKDNLIFSNRARRQSRNTGIELYFANVADNVHGKGNRSIRVTPTSDPLSPIVSLWNGIYGGDYQEVSTNGGVTAACVVDGTLNVIDDDNGYTVELGFSYDVLGGKKLDVYHFTAAFVQVGSYDRDIRYANTFIPGTGHTSPLKWKAINNDGIVTDKNALIDASVSCDEEVTIDGKLDEDFWTEAIQGNKGLGWTQTSTGISLSAYTYMTDLGLYIGLDSNDKSVYFNGNRAAKFNTGAEVFVVPNGETTIDVNAKQMRFNLLETTGRYIGTGDSTGWKTNFFPMLSAGSVKNGQLNSSDTDGWQGEIYIPWSSLGDEESVDKENIRLMFNLYHSGGDGDWVDNAQATAGGWTYLAPIDSFFRQFNAQEEFFLFTKENGYIVDGLSAYGADIDSTVTVTGANILENANGLVGDIQTAENYHYVDIPVNKKAMKARAGFVLSNGSGGDEIKAKTEVEYAYEKISDDAFRLYVKKDDAVLNKFASDVAFTYSTDGGKTDFIVGYDANLSVDGKTTSADGLANLIENKTVITSAVGNKSVSNTFWASAQEKAVYVTASVTDASVASGSAFEMALYAEDFAPDKAILIRKYASGGVEFYRYGKNAWGKDNALLSSVKVALGKTDDGYVVEAKIPWSAFGLSEGKAKVFVSPAIVAVENATDTSAVTLLGRKITPSWEYSLNKNNYLSFDENGFAPDKAYSISAVTFTKDDVNAFNNYVKKVTLSYLPFGGLDSDEVQTLTMAKESVESLSLSVENNEPVSLLHGNAIANVKVSYVDANASAVNEDDIRALINFDNDASNIVGKYYDDANWANDEITLVGEQDYEGDWAFISNNSKYNLSFDAPLGANSFTVMMTIDGDALRSCANGEVPYILFGTGNGAESGTGSGFEVMYASGRGFIVRTPDKYVDNTLLSVDDTKLYGTVVLTVAVDRIDNKMTFFIGGEEVGVVDIATGALYKKTYDIKDHYKLGVGSVGKAKASKVNYLDKDVTIDDIVLVDGAVTDKQRIFDVLQFVRQRNENSDFTTDIKGIYETFNTFKQGTNSRQTVITVNAKEGTTITVGGAWGEKAIVQGNKITIDYTLDDIIELSKGESWYAVDGVKKYIGVSYIGLTELIASEEQIDSWNKDYATGTATFDVYVSSGGVGVEDGNGLIFTAKDMGVLSSQALGGGYFRISIPLEDAKEINGEDTFTVSIDGNENVSVATIRFFYNQLINSEISKLQSGAMIYFDFEENVENNVTGKTATVEKRFASSTSPNATYDDGAYVANMLQRKLTVDGVTLGTDSFTVSALINGKDLKENTKSISNPGHATLLFGTGDVDSKNADGGFSVRAKQDGSLQVRIGGSYWLDGVGVINYDEIGDDYSRWIFVFDRETTGYLTFSVYINGELKFTKTAKTSASFDTNDDNGLFGIGGPGRNYADTTGYNGSRGTADIRFGDFFLSYGAMSARLIAGHDSYFNEIMQKGAFWAENINIRYEDVTGKDEVSVAMPILTGDAFTGDTSVVTFKEMDYSYRDGNLVIPKEVLNAFNGKQKVEYFVGGIEKFVFVSYVPLDQEKLNKYVSGMETFITFEDTIADLTGNKTTAMASGTATYKEGKVGKGILLNPATATVAISDLTLGKTSFTMSFDVMISAKNYAVTNNFYELVSSLNTDQSASGSNLDGTGDTFQISANGGRGNYRIQIGRNAGTEGGGSMYVGSPSPDGWQRVTVVVERETLENASKVIEADKYDKEGNYTNDVNDKGGWTATDNTVVKIYVDGICIQTRSAWYMEGQSFGSGTVTLGGIYKTVNKARDNDFIMDNFVLYRGAMTDDEVASLSSYYLAIEEALNEISAE